LAYEEAGFFAICLSGEGSLEPAPTLAYWWDHLEVLATIGIIHPVVGSHMVSIHSKTTGIMSMPHIQQRLTLFR
jgi:hypothetical protein